MDITQARLIVLKRFMRAARTSDLTDERLLEGYPGRPSDLVLALRDAGLLRRVRGRSRGVVYIATEAGIRFIRDVGGSS